MLFTSVAALLLPVAIIAAPTNQTAVDPQCAPIAYTVSEYTRSISPNNATISFNFKADFTVDNRVRDRVKDSVNCEADGPIITSRPNQCNAKGKKLKELYFTITGKQEEGNYRIDHKWSCKRATWQSVNKLTFPPCEPVQDGTSGDTVRCTIDPFIFPPQNVSKVVEDDTSDSSDSSTDSDTDDDKKVVKAAKPTAAIPLKCPKPPKCDA